MGHRVQCPCPSCLGACTFPSTARRRGPAERTSPPHKAASPAAGRREAALRHGAGHRHCRPADQAPGDGIARQQCELLSVSSSDAVTSVVRIHNPASSCSTICASNRSASSWRKRCASRYSRALISSEPQLIGGLWPDFSQVGAEGPMIPQHLCSSDDQTGGIRQRKSWHEIGSWRASSSPGCAAWASSAPPWSWPTHPCTLPVLMWSAHRHWPRLRAAAGHAGHRRDAVGAGSAVPLRPPPSPGPGVNRPCCSFRSSWLCLAAPG